MMDIEDKHFLILKSDSPFNAAGLINIKYKSCAPKLRSRWLRGIVRRCRAYHKWFLYLLYGIPLKYIEDASVIICFDERADFFLCQLISHCFKDKRLIIYSWNIIKEEDILRFKKLSWELWSFDQGDCQKYEMKFNKPFIAAASVNLENRALTIKQDVFFIGTDKGRKERILKVKDILDSIAISNKIIIVDPKLKNFNSAPMSYREILFEVQQSKAMLDVHIEGEEGISQRELEALFYRKKLLTTRKEVQNRDFYNPRNIYIIDSSHQHNDEIVQFLNSPLAEISDEIVQSYLFDEWLKRFLK
jgi:hypothetical protein